MKGKLTKLPTLPEHMILPPIFRGCHVVQFLVLCVVYCRSLFVLLCLVHFGHCIVCPFSLYVLRLPHFGIFKIVLQYYEGKVIFLQTTLSLIHM